MFAATIVGRLGQDPESRETSGGKTVVKLRVATDHGWGERKRTTWTTIYCFGKDGEFASNYLAKGQRVAVSGDVYLDEWEGRDGDKRVTLCMDARRVESIDRREGGGGPGRDERPPFREPTGRGTSRDDEEIPF